MFRWFVAEEPSSRPTPRSLFQNGDEKNENPGKPVRPYSLYRIGLNDEIIELVLRADTLEELEAHRRRPDWKYAIYQNRKRIDPR